MLNTCERVVKDWHIEVTHLIVPFKPENELLDDIEKMCRWIAEKLGSSVPLHFSRYFPNYHMRIESTPIELMKKAMEIALEHLDFVYMGNVALREGNDTVCPDCGAMLIERMGYNTRVRNLKDSRCTKCGRSVYIPGS